jgi:hypothetical protein
MGSGENYMAINTREIALACAKTFFTCPDGIVANQFADAATPVLDTFARRLVKEVVEAAAREVEVFAATDLDDEILENILKLASDPEQVGKMIEAAREA